MIEDAILTSPGYQFFSRDGDGFCYGTCLKKCQWICVLRVLQVQLMLYPNENIMVFTDTSGGPSYPGREEKLKHLQYLFSNFLLFPRNVLAGKLGMFDANEEAVAENVCEATTLYADCWFPREGPLIPTVDMCAD